MKGSVFTWPLIGVLLFINFLVLYVRFNSSIDEAATSRLRNEATDFASGDRRQELLVEWHSNAVTPAAAMRASDLVREECLDLPEGCIPLIPDAVAKKDREALVSVVAELVDAYSAGSPDALIGFMERRGQYLDASMMKRKREWYLQSHEEAIEADLPDDNTLFADYWEEWDYDAGWTGCIKEATCVSFGKCPKSIVGRIRANGSLGRGDKKVWQNVKTYPHHFSPNTGTLEAEVEAHGAVVFADVRLVVAHDERLYGQRSPYYLRFWFRSSDESWQPLLLSRSQIDLFQSDQLKLMF